LTEVQAVQAGGLCQGKLGYADSIGAGGYAVDAQSAVDKAKELLGM